MSEPEDHPNTPNPSETDGLGPPHNKKDGPPTFKDPGPDPNSGYGAHCALRKADQPQTNVTRTGDVNSCGCCGLRAATQNP
ncbi:hypothetical protein PCANC_01273 [Puccinia coronata f. sp. avenae]|uniref:Uncharacterized protein n=1 Tax=Puccinia coronata f. sp. avenae TaxID=200324 RepID=A0A2N5W3M4_9BASI|nr:hypothetical protein PCANC_01273 [Puccinia coronata f. sp. avenae]